MKVSLKLIDLKALHKGGDILESIAGITEQEIADWQFEHASEMEKLIDEVKSLCLLEPPDIASVDEPVEAALKQSRMV